MLSHTKQSTRKAKPLHVTDRDRELFQALEEHRVLTTDQLSHLFFPSLHRARKRLVQLWRHGLLIRAVRPTRLGEGSSQYLYALSRTGRRMVSDHSHRHGLSRRSLHEFRRHSEQINDFRICLTLGTRLTEDCAVSSWTQGSQLKMVAAPNYRGTNQVTKIIPDAMLTLTCRGRSYSYFLEIDRGTTDLGRITRKCAGYHGLWQQKVPQQRFALRSFRVLFVTTTRKRLDHLMRKLVQLRNSSSCPDLIAGAEASAVSLTQPQKLFAASWQTISDTGSVVSACPLPAPSFHRSRQRQEHHPCADQNPNASCKEPPGPADEGAPRLPGGGSGTDDTKSPVVGRPGTK